jgi:valine dehydrogenase (NAD+)
MEMTIEMTPVESPPALDLASSEILDPDHERVVIRQDPTTGLRFIVAIHSTVLGPALGGMRLRAYAGLRAALEDVLALARTMTLKASAAGLDVGGGKAVMIDDGRDELREQRLRAAAEVIEELHGAYITAEDIGTTTADMDLIARHTRYVVGRSPERGGGGDPSPITALTVLEATRRGLRFACGSSEPAGRRVGIIGLGKVGSALAGHLVDAGAEVVGFDVRAETAERVADELGVDLAPTAEAVLGSELDVLSPCAAGGLIDDALAGSIECRVVAGAANNPLTRASVADRLATRGIVYVPDFLANCGGLIHVESEWRGTSRSAEQARIANAMRGLERALADARLEGTTPLRVAERQALERVERARAAGARGAG